MYGDHSVAVVVPCHNEEALIGRVLDTMPCFVDKIVVVDDASSDSTAEVVRQVQQGSDNVELIQLEKNQGVGGAIVAGYRWTRERGFDITVVMAGDAQMDPEDLPALLDPLVERRADYAKGDRLSDQHAWDKIPVVRFFGNAFLSLLTKVVSGYWHISDSQTGYTAITSDALCRLDLDAIFKRYGMPNDLLVRLNVENLRVADVPIKPVYNVGEKSGIRLRSVVPTLSWLLARLFVWRLKEKYIVRDFHPLVLFYATGLGMMMFSAAMLANMAYAWMNEGIAIDKLDVYATLFCMVVGVYSLFFGMWSDKEYNKHLQGKLEPDSHIYGFPTRGRENESGGRSAEQPPRKVAA